LSDSAGSSGWREPASGRRTANDAAATGWNGQYRRAAVRSRLSRMSQEGQSPDRAVSPAAEPSDGQPEPQRVEPEISVRRAEPADFEAAAALAGQLLRQHHEVDPGRFFIVDDVEQGYAHWFRRESARREAVILVAVQDGRVVGYSYGTLEDRDWNALLDRHGAIHDIFVSASARQRGTGRRLIDAMLRELGALGAPRFVLSTMVNNIPAQRLFAKAGFRPTMLEMTCGG
jgi:ribosomal protein S18 acetylase RimI-like enzyme